MTELQAKHPTRRASLLGIPDLWEIWTRSDPLTPDSWLDRDGDGLNDLYEFWYQTDPRTADTDGDGFSDYFEIDNGMDPLLKADFSPEEPDANGNGIIDLWEGSGGAGGIVLPVTLTGTVVRLRLPFGEDTTLRLIAAPPGDEPAAGQLWKARLRVEPAPARSGQRVFGDGIVAADGGVIQRRVERESILTLFGAAGSGARMVLAGIPVDEAVVLLLTRGYEIRPQRDVYFHRPGERVAPFLATNLAHVAASEIVWSADHGAMSPTNGTISTLTVESIPYGGRPIIVRASARLLDGHDYAQKTEVWPCPRRVFALESYTGNFSPHLGEEMGFTVAIPGCLHERDPGWLEAEIMRETTAGWQHVAWVDMDAGKAGVQSSIPTTNLAHSVSFSWDGIARATLPLAEHPDVFTGGTQPFHRAMPAVVPGEPVPPPFVELRVRHWNTERDKILTERSRRIHVPQVVKIEMTDAAFEEFKKPIIYPDTYWPQAIGDLEVNTGLSEIAYEGAFSVAKAQIIDQIADAFLDIIPYDVNLRVTKESAHGRCKLVKISTISDGIPDYDGAGGFTPNSSISWRNSNPVGHCYVYADKIRKNPFIERLNVETGIQASIMYSKELFPFTPTELSKAYASTAVHETGHMLGLVNVILYGSSYHNHAPTMRWWIMNKSRPAIIRFCKEGAESQTFKMGNYNYLRFILPKAQ